MTVDPQQLINYPQIINHWRSEIIRHEQAIIEHQRDIDTATAMLGEILNTQSGNPVIGQMPCGCPLRLPISHRPGCSEYQPPEVDPGFINHVIKTMAENMTKAEQRVKETHAEQSSRLSSRLRSGVECAPWVIEEVKALESHIEDLEKALQPFAEMDRDNCDLNELACKRGDAEDLTYLTSGDFRNAKNVLNTSARIMPDSAGKRAFLVALASGGTMEDPVVQYVEPEIIETTAPDDAVKIYNAKHNCSFYYGRCLGEIIRGEVRIPVKLLIHSTLSKNAGHSQTEYDQLDYECRQATYAYDRWKRYAKMLEIESAAMKETLSVLQAYRKVLLDIAFGTSSGEPVRSVQSNPELNPSCMAYNVLGGRWDQGVRLDSRELLEKHLREEP